MPRHLLVNALFLNPGVSGGPETYIRGLLPALREQRPQMRITIATTRSGAAALGRSGWGEWAEIVALPCEDGQRLRRQWAEQVLLRRLMRRCGADLLHSTSSVAPIRAGGRHVITIHDVTFVVTPTFGRVTTWGMRQVIARAARRADALIAISRAARDQICEVLELDPDRFTVAHNGFGRPSAEPSIGADEIRARFAARGRRLVVCVAAKRPHKNQALLIRAAAQLQDTVFVLAGHAEGYERELRALAGELGVESRVRFAPYLPDGELEALWRAADCAALPTLGEGFGLPLLEAMSRGLPVAASDIPVFREIGGDLPHWFDPGDPHACARAIEAAIADREAAAAGPAHAATFTWQRAAQGTLEAYERALSAAAPAAGRARSRRSRAPR